MRTITVYHADGTKSEYTKGSYRCDDRASLPLHERMMRSYYDLECQHKLRPGKNYNRIKSIWQRDGERSAAGLE